MSVTAEEATSVGSVYVLGCAENHRVKIGRTVNLDGRLADIQRMSPVRLNLLWHTPGGADVETLLHRQFSFLRSHGEWFDFDGVDPIAAIRSVLEGWPYELREPYGPLALAREGLVWIAARRREGPRIGSVTGIGHRWTGEWGYQVRDATGQSKVEYHFEEEEVVPCYLGKEHMTVGSPWPEAAPRSSSRPRVPGYGADL
jgi:hypothetical protein